MEQQEGLLMHLVLAPLSIALHRILASRKYNLYRNSNRGRIHNLDQSAQEAP